ncbi:hypothetical protein DDN51_17435 [Vibrio cholerae]|nr:hypothetical protein [Vibrio cholerae]
MKKKSIFILFTYLGVFLGGMPCYAGSYTPHDLIEGRLPSNDKSIILNLANGNWTKNIVLPQKPNNGDQVNIKSNADWDSQVDGNIIGFNSIKIKSGDQIELVYKKVTDSTFAWTLKDELSPNNSGVVIPNDKKYTAYFVEDGNWANRLYLPEEKGVVEKIIIRSRARYDTYIDKKMIAGNSDLKISTNDVVEFTWNSKLNEWTVFKQGDLNSLKTSVRQLAFLDMSLDTNTQGMNLYNNGRMQKPIEITYKACLLADYMDNDNRCDPVAVTQDEIKYYIRLGLHLRSDAGYPEELANIYPEFVIDYERDTRYETRLPVVLSDTIMTKENTDQNKQTRTATIWLRYKAKSISEQKNVSLCTFSLYEDQEGNDIQGANTNDCGPNGLGSQAREISVIDGSYKGSITNNTSILKDKVELVELCKTEDDCAGRPGWHVKNGQSSDISYVRANLYKYSANRPGHRFLPIINAESTSLSEGCVSDSAGGSDTVDDGICHHVVGDGYAEYSFYTSNLQFGSAKTVAVSYSTYIRGYSASELDSWKFDSDSFDTDRYGSFSIYSVLPVINIKKSASNKNFVRWNKNGHWAGSTQSSLMPITSLIEDNYGNRFQFSATLFAEPNVGATAGKSKNYALTRVKDEKFYPMLE